MARVSVTLLRRLLVRLAVGTAALVPLVAGITLDGVDHRPYVSAPYATETDARLRESLRQAVVVEGDLDAGFGRARLTPTINVERDDPGKGLFRSMPLAGYGNRDGKPATGVHDDLEVKAIALRVSGHVGVMVGADALIIPPEVTALVMHRVESELHLARQQVYLSATHTHNSLGAWGEGRVAESFAGGFQPGARVWFADRIVTAVAAALGDLAPAEFGEGRFDAPEFVRNRLVQDRGTVDPEFSFLVLKQAGGRVGVLGSYSAHATVLPAAVTELSADYPGWWQRAVESATGGIAVFVAGGVGSHGPVAPTRDFAGAQAMGEGLAHRLLDALPNVPLSRRVTFGTVGLTVSLPELNVRVSDGVRLRPWLAGQLLPASTRTYLQAFRLQDAVWIATPCDFSGEIALGIKDFLHARTNRRAVITSFNGDYVGYVVPPRYYHMDGYEPRTMSFFGPAIPDYFDELIRRMALHLANR
jgi:neutral ceramidase